MEKARYSFFIRIIFLCIFTISASKCSAGITTALASHALGGTKHLLRAVHATLGTSGVIGCAAAATALFSLMTLYERYFTLPDYEDSLMPPAGEDLSGRRKHIYTWHPRDLDLSTTENLRNALTHDNNNQWTANLNDCRLIPALRRDCVAFNIYRKNHIESVISGDMPERTLHPIESGDIYWRDLIATLNYEVRKLTEIKEYLRRASRWRIFPRIDRYSIGAERDLANAFHAQHINDKEEERQMTNLDENVINHTMNQEISLTTRIFAALCGAPNYYKTYSLYWKAYRRLLWLEELKENIERAAASQNCFDKIFAQVRDHTVYEIDPHGNAHIVAPVNPLRVPVQNNAPAREGH